MGGAFRVIRDTRIHSVGPRNRLHQGMRLHRLVQIQRGQALHVKAGQPHGADDGDPERMLGVLEGQLDVNALAAGGLETLLHQRAVRDDVEVPFPEIGDFVLRLADDDLDQRLVHPVGLGLEPVGFGQSLLCCAYYGSFPPPARHDELMHVCARCGSGCGS